MTTVWLVLAVLVVAGVAFAAVSDLRGRRRGHRLRRDIGRTVREDRRNLRVGRIRHHRPPDS